MSKMSDMAQTIEELRSAAAAITDAANWLSQQFNSDAEEAPITEAHPERKPELTLEQVRAVLAESPALATPPQSGISCRSTAQQSYLRLTPSTMRPC